MAEAGITSQSRPAKGADSRQYEVEKEEDDMRRERGRLDVRHSPHNEAVNVVIPIHVAKLEVSGDARQISGMRKQNSASKTTCNTVKRALLPVSVDCRKLGRQRSCTMAHKYETPLNGIACSRYGKLGSL